MRKTVLRKNEYCVVLDPIDEDERPQLGKKEVRKGISSFFLHPGKIYFGEYDDSYKCFAEKSLGSMTHLHCLRRTRIRIPDPTATL